jgi:membrane protein
MLRAAWHLLRDAAAAWVDDYAPSMGAALAYYTLFSIAPLLLIVISLAGWVFGEQAARGEIMSQLSGLVGLESAHAIESLLQAVNQPDGGIAATVASAVAMAIGATTVFAELQSAMDRIWRAPTTPRSGLWHLVRGRLLSLGMVLGIGFLLIVSLIASAALAALGKFWGPWLGELMWLANALDIALSFAFVTTVFAMIYKWMPRVKVAWQDVWVGAAITALLFTIGKWLIGQYIGRSGVATAFGAAASLVVLLLWVYYSAQIFLLGAEFTWVFAHRHGSLQGHDADGPGTPPPAEPAVTTPVKPPAQSAR